MKTIRNLALTLVLSGVYLASVGNLRAHTANFDSCGDADTSCGDGCYGTWNSCVTLCAGNQACAHTCDLAYESCNGGCFCTYVNCECDNGNETYCPPSSWGC
jgi:hypothetical protein